MQIPMTRLIAAVAICESSSATTVNGMRTPTRVARTMIQLKKLTGRGISSSIRCSSPVARIATANAPNA